jgi:hypothetical protein
MKKWEGKSLYQLEQRRQRVHNLDIALSELGRVRREARQSYLDELGRILERDPQNLELGHWECEGSPTKSCVYDLSTDERDDECLFCEQASERK